MVDSRESGEVGLHVLVESDVGTFVSDGIAVIGSREDGDAFATCLYKVTLVFDFMGSHQKFKVVLLEEGVDDIWPKRHSCPSFGGCPSRKSRRIRPEYVIHDPILRRLSKSVDLTDFVDRDSLFLKEATMTDEDLVVE